MEDCFTSFVCAKCNSEIEASPDLIGEETECPACGAKLVIPGPNDDGIIRHSAGDDDPDTLEAMKSRTIRIELEDI